MKKSLTNRSTFASALIVASGLCFQAHADVIFYELRHSRVRS